eukprot:5273071-Amphidinium_carterae.1
MPGCTICWPKVDLVKYISIILTDFTTAAFLVLGNVAIHGVDIRQAVALWGTAALWACAHKVSAAHSSSDSPIKATLPTTTSLLAGTCNKGMWESMRSRVLRQQ